MFGYGNSKLPKSTIIFNMGPAKNCPSKRKGLCKVAKDCYARKAEIQYPPVYPYRKKQMVFWLDNNAETIWQAFDKEISRKRNKPTLFRYNESGDFFTQECVTKLDYIAGKLKEKYGIKTYGYTARADLDFSGVKNFKVKGSGHDHGNNGQCAVFDKGVEIPVDYKVCSGSCKTCSICAESDDNIAFIKH